MDLGDRMKLYEAIPRTRLLPKVPVLIRVDGRAFHTFTHGMDKPLDSVLWNAMCDAARALCEDISGAQLAYVQSDEISVLVTDTQARETQPWFDYDVQKVVSVSASVATGGLIQSLGILRRMPAFDGRAWNLPPAEVCNYFIWRQQDAIRNSIQGLAQAHFSPKQLHGVNTSGMLDMLREKGVSWNACPTTQRRGACVYREVYEKEGEDSAPVTRHRWIVDREIPLFTEEREYVEKFLHPPLPASS